MSNLITENSNLIWSIVSRFKDRGYDIEDLYQIGCIGFIKSIKRFDSNYDVKLSTYAVPYILGEIKRFIRDDGPVKVSRSIKELSYKIKIVQSEFVNKKGREAKIEELSKVLKVGKDEILIAIDSSNSVESIDRNISDSDDLTIMDKLKSNIDEEKEIINRITVKDLINGLDEKSKKIIMLRYFRGRTQSQVANLMGVSQVQVSRMEKRILNSMKLILTSTVN
ncbi:MAG: SigB/SigF/SigG family RNA polymerase sigma factor [Clostridia bacterium]|nr:SigB/SigF/SigG family RNA polymerase sigma factor [Clostridia bacterium]